MTKLKLYDGEKQVGDWDQKHIRELQEEFMDEGMSGVSPALRHQPHLGGAGQRRQRLRHAD